MSFIDVTKDMRLTDHRLANDIDECGDEHQRNIWDINNLRVENEKLMKSMSHDEMIEFMFGRFEPSHEFQKREEFYASRNKDNSTGRHN